ARRAGGSLCRGRPIRRGEPPRATRPRRRDPGRADRGRRAIPPAARALPIGSIPAPAVALGPPPRRDRRGRFPGCLHMHFFYGFLSPTAVASTPRIGLGAVD